MKTTCFLMFLTFAIIIGNSCKTTPINQALKEFNELKNIKEGSKITIIPGSGCTGCIKGIESFAIENANSDSLFFIFTRINSLKLFRNRFGNSFVNSPNIIVDIENKFKYENKDYEIYPVEYKKQNGIIFLNKYLKP